MKFKYKSIINMADRFCYWDAKSRPDIIVIIFNQTVVTTFFVIAVLRLIMLRRLPSGLTIDVRMIAMIHLLVLFWTMGYCYLIQCSSPSTTTPSSPICTCQKRKSPMQTCTATPASTPSLVPSLATPCKHSSSSFATPCIPSSTQLQ